MLPVQPVDDIDVQPVDDIDEVHQLDPVHQVDHKDERCDDIGRFCVEVVCFWVEINSFCVEIAFYGAGDFFVLVLFGFFRKMFCRNYVGVRGGL